MNKAFFIVKTNPLEGSDDEMLAWYNTFHLKEVVAIEGFLSGQLFKLADAQMTDVQSHQYLAMYEVDSSDIEGAVNRLREAFPNMTMEPVMDHTTGQPSFFKSVTDYVT